MSREDEEWERQRLEQRRIDKEDKAEYDADRIQDERSDNEG